MEIASKFLMFLTMGLALCCAFWRNRLLIRVVLFLAVLSVGAGWRVAVVEFRERPERAMARIVHIQRLERQEAFFRSNKRAQGCTLDVVFRDSQGEQREVQGMDYLTTSRCSQENIGRSIEIACAAHAPEQAMPANDDSRLMFKILFFIVLAVFLSDFFLKPRLFIRD
jgi:hypothetical protein